MTNKLKFVIDTNIFIAGLINEKGACRKLIDHSIIVKVSKALEALERYLSIS